MTSTTYPFAAVSGVILLLSAGAASAQSTAAVQNPANRADLGCLAVTAIAISAAEAGSVEQAGLIGGMTYYLGRLEGRAPSVNWLDQMKTYLESDMEQVLKTDGERCSTEMIAMGARLTRWGEEIQALAAKQGGADKGDAPGGKQEP